MVTTMEEATDIRSAAGPLRRKRFEDIAEALALDPARLLAAEWAPMNVPAGAMWVAESRLVGARPPYPFWPPDMVAELEQTRRAVVAAGGSEFEITPVQYGVLSTLSLNPGIDPASLAQ